MNEIFMDIFAQIRDSVIESVLPFAGDASLDRIVVEPPKDAAHGDMATNAAMMIAKQLGVSPRDIAQKISGTLENNPLIQAVSVAGPGFINIKLHPQAWQSTLKHMCKNPQSYGHSNLGQGQHVNIEFVSANPTGPLHVGHMRGAVVGDALANLLVATGYKVTREYYVNDGGAQVDVLARSLYLRYIEAHGHAVTFPENAYPGDYLVPIGEALCKKYGGQYIDAPEEAWLDLFRQEGIEAMMCLIRTDLRDLGVNMDHYFSEKSLYETGKIEAAIALLDKRGLIYQGTLPPPKGIESDSWISREQTLFRSSAFGDDTDRPIQKEDGSWTYFTPDIAYHYDKIERGADMLIDVWGVDHGGYVTRMKAAVQALSDSKVPLDVKLCQLVKVLKNGAPVKMSKRAGNFILMRDVLDEVGAGAARFVILTRKPDAPLDFDFDKIKEQTRENPVFYVQYAHARANSVIEKAGDPKEGDPSLLVDPEEIKLIRIMATYPRVLRLAAETHEPHRIAYYLYDLASAFHALNHAGKLDPKLRFIHETDTELTHARLSLVRSVRGLIANGLQILGVSPINKM